MFPAFIITFLAEFIHKMNWLLCGGTLFRKDFHIFNLVKKKINKEIDVFEH